METTPPEKQDDSAASAKDSSKWFDSRAQCLEYEEFIAEISKLRSRRETQKSWWQKLLETSGGAALITVLIGGLLGQVISMSIQKSLKERERELVAYTKFVDQGSETVKNAYAIIGTCISTSDDLISITEPEFNPEKTDPELEEQKKGIVKKFNETNTKWREEQHRLGLLMRYYHYNAGDVAREWKVIQDSTIKYMDCASIRHGEFIQSEVGKESPRGKEKSLTSCDNQKSAIIGALDKFAQSVENYWKDIDNTNSR